MKPREEADQDKPPTHDDDVVHGCAIDLFVVKVIAAVIDERVGGLPCFFNEFANFHAHVREFPIFTALLSSLPAAESPYASRISQRFALTHASERRFKHPVSVISQHILQGPARWGVRLDAQIRITLSVEESLAVREGREKI